MANGEGRTPDAEVLWKLYESNVGLFKHFLDLVLKFNVFYYAVSGAVFSFYFSRLPNLTARPSTPLVAALAFVVLMSLGFGTFFGYAATRVKDLGRPTKNYQARLEELARPDLAEFNPTPEIKVLTVATCVTAGLLFAIALLTLGYLTWALCKA